MGFVQFVEAIVQCVCECTVSNLTRRLQHPSDPAGAPASLYYRVSEIREEAMQLLDLFGLLSLPTVLALTKRPLKRASIPEGTQEDERDAVNGSSRPAGKTLSQPKLLAALKLLKPPIGKSPA